MTTLVDVSVPVDEITERARKVSFGRALLTFLASLLYAVGWVVAKVWFGIVWCAIAVQVGWREARSATGGG